MSEPTQVEPQREIRAGDPGSCTPGKAAACCQSERVGAPNIGFHGYRCPRCGSVDWL